MPDPTIDNARLNIISGLGDLGLYVPTGQMTPQRREWRWVMQIGADRICHFAESECARRRLEHERQLLCALEGRVLCKIPSVFAVSNDRRLQVRRMILGDQIQNREFQVGTLKGWEHMAETYGAAIASLHRAIDPSEATAFIQARPENLPYPAEQLRPLADRWIRDAGLARAVIGILDAYAAIRVAAQDRALIHGDLTADNMVFDLSTSRFIGMFDFAEAAVTDRHLDLKYIHSFGSLFAERLMDRYESEAGIPLDRQRPAIYHIASAVSHLKSESCQCRPPPQQERVEQWVRPIIDDAF